MFRPHEAISTVRKRTYVVAGGRARASVGACAVAGLTSCAGSAALPTPHLATIQSAVTCPAPPTHTPVLDAVHHYATPPRQLLARNLGYCAYIATSRGVISIRLRPEYAPNAVNDFVFLAKQGFYDGQTVEQVCPATVGVPCPAQVPLAIAGDPTGSGTGGPGYAVKADAVVGQYLFGAVAMYTSGSAALGSQFLISTGATQALPRRYDIFGQVTDGIPALVQLRKGDAILWITIANTPPEP